MQASWPKEGKIDEIQIKKSNYLMDAAHSFRLFYKNHLAANKSNKNMPNTPVPKPNFATIYVGEYFPPWQSCVLTTMKELYTANGDKLPDNKILSTELCKKPELKKYAKKVMPFAQAVREKMDVIGVKALSLTLDFNEMEVLQKNIEYLENTLELDGIALTSSSHHDAPQRVKDECCPGSPYITYELKKGCPVTINNNQQHSGLFQRQIELFSDDTVEKIAKRLSRGSKVIKG